MAVREVKDERGQTVCVVPAQHEREPRGGEYTGRVLSPDAVEGAKAKDAFARLDAYEPPPAPLAPPGPGDHRVAELEAKIAELEALMSKVREQAPA